METPPPPGVAVKTVIAVGAENGVSRSEQRRQARAGGDLAAAAPGLESVDHHFLTSGKAGLKLQFKAQQLNGLRRGQINGNPAAQFQQAAVTLKSHRRARSGISKIMKVL